MNAIDREMEKLKAMGVTIETRLSPNGRLPRAASIIADAAERHGIAYDSAKRLPSEWEAIFDIRVMDPDGWDRSNWAKSWGTRISETEFADRAAQSTCSGDFSRLRAVQARRSNGDADG